MQRLVIVAHLKDGVQDRATELLEKGPPYDPGQVGFEAHSVFLSATDVVFVFEAPEVEWLVDELVDDPFRPPVSEALAEWRPLIEGRPRIARERYFWRREVTDDAGAR